MTTSPHKFEQKIESMKKDIEASWKKHGYKVRVSDLTISVNGTGNIQVKADFEGGKKLKKKVNLEPGMTPFNDAYEILYKTRADIDIHCAELGVSEDGDSYRVTGAVYENDWTKSAPK